HTRFSRDWSSDVCSSDLNPRRLALPGTFTSAGIFPDIREELNVMPDYSLGFSGETGKAGLPAYGGPAKFFNKLYLSNQGLRGKGDRKSTRLNSSHVKISY